MRTWEEIKQEVEDYKASRMALLKEYVTGQCVECTHDDKTYYGRVDHKFFDDKKGKVTMKVKLNKNQVITWSSTRDNKSYFNDDELEQVKLIDNTLDKDKIAKLEEKLESLDEEPMTKQQRDEEERRIKHELLDIRKTTCIHNWEEVKEGSWLNEKLVGYECCECGLILDDEQKIDYEKML